ncbi:MAG: hypothetical protein QOG54_884 [Actinomycetota bacterium]|nr:hypothetical protein [Actinomycetota bacterium]
MRKSIAVVAMAIGFMIVVASGAEAQQRLDCAPTYEGIKGKVGAQVQLQDGTWVTVTDPKVCMGESVASAAAHAEEQAAATSENGELVLSSNSSNAASSGSAPAAVPQGAANTGLGGMSDEATATLLVSLLTGAVVAAGIGAFIGRRRAA